MGSIHQNDESISLITQLSRRAPRLSNDQDRDAKRECLQLSKALTAQLEQPENVAIDLAGSPMIAVSARIAVDLNLFALILHHGPVTSARLAKLSGAEELLIVRILRPLSAEHFVEETAARTWQATRITQAMSTAEIAAGYRMMFEHPFLSQHLPHNQLKSNNNPRSQLIVPAMQSAPSYFQTRGPSCPIDPTDGLVQHAFQTTQTTFDRIAASPSLLSDFALFMGNTMGARKYWVDWYPVQERILDGADTEKVLIVDVGGGKGHDLMAYQARFPNSGKLVLEDLKAVTDAVDGDGDLDPGIQRLEYDFFTRQPVCGARVYFYHHILHDWSDAYCLRILDRVAAAMTPGYSRLLIHEMLVLERGASRFQAQLDMTMMAFNGGMERTREQWRALLERAGLTVVGFWDPVDEGGDGIVEAMVS